MSQTNQKNITRTGRRATHSPVVSPCTPSFTPVAHSLSTTTISRLQRSPGQLAPSDMLVLQRTMGNHQLQQMLARPSDALAIQRKLMVGPANDRYEQEAEQIASQVAAPDGTVLDRGHSMPTRVQRTEFLQRAEAEIGPEGGGIVQWAGARYPTL